MTRMVLCCVKKKELKGLDRKPMPGPIGERVFNTVSEEAWREWQEIQTMMINEYKMTLMNKTDREVLMEQLDKFLNGEEVDKPGEFKPLSQR